MAHIHINRKPLSPKALRRVDRKQMVRVGLRSRQMRDAFAQLSPIDEYYIRKRVQGEIKPMSPLGYWANMIELSYKYTCELLNTVCV